MIRRFEIQARVDPGVTLEKPQEHTNQQNMTKDQPSEHEKLNKRRGETTLYKSFTDFFLYQPGNANLRNRRR